MFRFNPITKLINQFCHAQPIGAPDATKIPSVVAYFSAVADHCR